MPGRRHCMMFIFLAMVGVAVVVAAGIGSCKIEEPAGAAMIPLPCRADMVSVEKRLVKMLLDRYDTFGRNGRPVKNRSDTVQVKFDLNLIQILDVDEKNQILKTNIWYNYRWTDVLLTWDPANYHGVTEVRVYPHNIWLPDVLLYNFADERLHEQRDALVVVSHDGSLLWMPQAILKSSCRFDTLYFPFDYQKCKMKFGSWTYNGLSLNLDFNSQERFDLSQYIENKQWAIVNNTAFRNVLRYQCCPEPYPDLTYHLTLKRNVAFYSFILLLPSALLSLLVLVIFYVPPESPAKLQLGMNIFVAFFILLMLLAESTPKSSNNIPLIGAYFCLSMVMITMSTVLSAFVANMFFRGVRVNRAPKWLRSCMIDGIARLLCVRHKIVEKEIRPPRRTWGSRVGGQSREIYSDADLRYSKVRLLDNGTPMEKLNNCNDFQHHHPDTLPRQTRETQFTDMEHHATIGSMGPVGTGPMGGTETIRTIPPQTNTGTVSTKSAVLEEVRVIRDILENVREKKSKLEDKEKYLREWRVIACITDRIFFITYVLVNCTALLVIFLSNQGNVPPLPLPSDQES